MKKLTLLSIVFTIILALSSAVFADETISANPGKDVTVTINLGKQVASGDYTVKYDPNVLTYKSASPVFNQEAKEGVLHVNFFAGQESGIVDKLTLTFTVAANAKGSTNLEFTPNVFGDFDSKAVEVAAQTLTVSIATQTPDENNVVKNEVVNDVTDDPTDENEVVPGEVVPGEVVPGDVVETPSPTNTVKDDNDDKSTFDQTGANIAIFAVIALAVVLGSTIVIKRK